MERARKGTNSLISEEEGDRNIILAPFLFGKLKLLRSMIQPSSYYLQARRRSARGPRQKRKVGGSDSCQDWGACCQVSLEWTSSSNTTPWSSGPPPLAPDGTRASVSEGTTDVVDIDVDVGVRGKTWM